MFSVEFRKCLVGVLCLVFVLLCIAKCIFEFCNHLDEDERAGCFALVVFLMPCSCKCSVALPHGALGWSVEYDCDISCSYLLTVL